jgi:hypothetical protein
MRRRTWHYVCKPAVYEIACDKCHGTNIEWSEFEHMIWCYDCKIDTPGTGGIFDSPIPMGVTELLGMSLDRYNIKKDRIESPRIVGHQIKYFAKVENRAKII